MIEDGHTLAVAIREGHTGVVELLVKLGADINQQSAGGRTPRAKANKRGNDETAAFLQRIGAME